MFRFDIVKRSMQVLVALSLSVVSIWHCDILSIGHLLNAGLAFHPIDGILQACPHVIVLFIQPMHFFSHEVLLFLEAIWTTNIHDCIDGNVWGIMGAGFHTIHHTTYKHNYGHYTVFFDWLFGTLRDPYERKVTAHAKAS